MAMAVAVKMSPETAPQQPLNRLAVGSVAGTIYVLACLAIIYAIPVLWRTLPIVGGESLSQILMGTAGLFVDAALRLLIMLGVAAVLVLFGRRLIGSNPPPGIRAGICFGVLGVVLVGLVTRGIGAMLERNLGANGAVTGIAMTSAIGLALLVAGGMSFFKAGFERWLVLIEDQGWFSAAAYKRTQGQRVRRGTMLGLLILVVTGIYTLLSHKTLETAAANWEIPLPFTQGKTLLLLPDVRFTVPLLLALGGLWLSYRVVNFPAFADFLIATEAELNKVSWPTRKRLIQDTVVVLTTMLLLTAFLFAMDSVWIGALSNRWVNVVQPPEGADTHSIDAQIEKLNEERQAAVGKNDKQAVNQIDSKIEDLKQQRESILRGKQGGPQDW
jgi:preprotein translocase SecE subunit